MLPESDHGESNSWGAVGMASCRTSQLATPGVRHVRTPFDQRESTPAAPRGSNVTFNLRELLAASSPADDAHES